MTTRLLSSRRDSTRLSPGRRGKAKGAGRRARHQPSHSAPPSTPRTTGTSSVAVSSHRPRYMTHDGSTHSRPPCGTVYTHDTTQSRLSRLGRVACGSRATASSRQPARTPHACDGALCIVRKGPWRGGREHPVPAAGPPHRPVARRDARLAPARREEDSGSPYERMRWRSRRHLREDRPCRLPPCPCPRRASGNL